MSARYDDNGARPLLDLAAPTDAAWWADFKDGGESDGCHALIIGDPSASAFVVPGTLAELREFVANVTRLIDRAERAEVTTAAGGDGQAADDAPAYRWAHHYAPGTDGQPGVWCRWSGVDAPASAATNGGACPAECPGSRLEPVNG